MEKGFNLQMAQMEAERCLLCYDAPCSKKCPAGTDPAKFIRKLRMKNVTGAIRTIKTNNILGGACGVLCPSSRLCEKECIAKGLDRPIRIREIQRALIEHSWKIGFNPFTRPSKNSKKIAVIGAGPAGLACASELLKEGFSVTVFEERGGPGGVLGFGVPDHRFPRDFLKKEIEDLEFLGAEFKFNTPIKNGSSFEKLIKEDYSAVFISVGLWQPIRIINKEANGIYTAMDLLESAKGKKTEETKKLFSGKKVVVIGGGSVAIDCAETAVKLGAKDVYLIYRRAFLQMPAEKEELNSALENGVQFLLLNQPVDYLVEDNRLKAVVLARTELGDVDSSGRRSPVEFSGSQWRLDADAVIEAAGAEAESSIPDWFSGLKMDKKRLIVVDPDTNETSTSRVFAGGDITRGPALIVDAIADGKNAARTIIKRFASREKR